jgi:hypothetical protein
MSKTASIVLKSPAEPMPLRVAFTIHEKSPARRVRLLLDGREVAAQTYAGPGAYTLASPPVQAASAVAVVTIEIDATFTSRPTPATPESCWPEWVSSASPAVS